MASENELIWLDIYLNTGDSKQAVRDVFNCSEKNVAAKASGLKNKLADEIDQQFAKIIKKDSIKAFRIISGLMTTASQESVKLKAAQDILSRAGYDSVTRFESISKEETYPELMNRLQAAFTGLDADVLAQILGNTKDLKEITMLAMGHAGTEQ